MILMVQKYTNRFVFENPIDQALCPEFSPPNPPGGLKLLFNRLTCVNILDLCHLFVSLSVFFHCALSPVPSSITYPFTVFHFLYHQQLI
jgi:hypothetical protein